MFGIFMVDQETCDSNDKSNSFIDGKIDLENAILCDMKWLR